jgi:hypothetical protein
MAAQDARADHPARGDPGVPGAPRRRLWASRSPGRAVARFADGRVLKGYADFDPARPCFRLLPAESREAAPVEVAVRDLKALFFVRSYDGDPDRAEVKDLYQPRPPGTRKVCVQFADGEELVGYTRQLDRHPQGLFFTPLDPRSNNLRVFAVFDAIDSIRRLL